MHDSCVPRLFEHGHYPTTDVTPSSSDQERSRSLWRHFANTTNYSCERELSSTARMTSRGYTTHFVHNGSKRFVKGFFERADYQYEKVVAATLAAVPGFATLHDDTIDHLIYGWVSEGPSAVSLSQYAQHLAHVHHAVLHVSDKRRLGIISQVARKHFTRPSTFRAQGADNIYLAVPDQKRGHVRMDAGGTITQLDNGGLAWGGKWQLDLIAAPYLTWAGGDEYACTRDHFAAMVDIYDTCRTELGVISSRHVMDDLRSYAEYDTRQVVNAPWL